MNIIGQMARICDMVISKIFLLWMFIPVTCDAQTFIEDKQDTTLITEYNDGMLWAYKRRGDIVVGLTSYEEKDDYGKYYQVKIFIHNQGDTSVLFIPDDITSRLVTNKGDTLNCLVYTNEAYQKKIKNAQTLAMLLYGFSSGLNSGMAGRSTSYSTTYSSNGYSYMTVTNHYNPTDAYQANLTASYQIATLGNMMKRDREIKEQGYLKKTTIHPGESIIGYINIKRRKGNILTINVLIGENIYSFDWNVKRNNSRG